MALLCRPSSASNLLLGAPLQEASAVTVARIGGAGLLTLGIACWLARRDARSPAARGLITAMVIYNIGVALILGTAGLRSQPVGIILWPAVVLHTVMTAWCIMSLRSPGIAERPGKFSQQL